MVVGGGKFQIPNPKFQQNPNRTNPKNSPGRSRHPMDFNHRWTLMDTDFTGGNADDGEWPLLRGRVIVLQSLAHAYDVVKGEAEAAVEFDDAVVGSSNLEIDFGA